MKFGLNLSDVENWRLLDRLVGGVDKLERPGVYPLPADVADMVREQHADILDSMAPEKANSFVKNVVAAARDLLSPEKRPEIFRTQKQMTSKAADFAEAVGLSLLQAIYSEEKVKAQEEMNQASRDFPERVGAEQREALTHHARAFVDSTIRPEPNPSASFIDESRRLDLMQDASLHLLGGDHFNAELYLKWLADEFPDSESATLARSVVKEMTEAAQEERRVALAAAPAAAAAAAETPGE